MPELTPDLPPARPGSSDADAHAVVARATEIARTLVARQDETEKRTYYAEDTHEDFREAGFYRILVPRRYGGTELGIGTFMRVALELIRGCPSTGWMFTLGAAHALPVATLFGEAAQDELFRGRDFLCPATVMPSGTAVRGDGHWKISGTWRYCSGAPYATHFMGHTLVDGDGDGDGGEPEPMLFIAPRSDWRMLDDWGGHLGQRGSGSHSIELIDAVVPDRFTIRNHLSQLSVTGGTPGRDLHGNPLYGGGLLSVMVLEDAVLAVGMARNALDAYADLMNSRTTSFPPIVDRTADPDFQSWYGLAAGRIDTAHAAFLRSIQEWEDLCEAGPQAFTPLAELRIAGICREVVRLSWSAVADYLFPTAGSSSVRQGERIERVWRDLSMLYSHAGVAVYLSALAPREFAKARFGVAA